MSSESASSPATSSPARPARGKSILVDALHLVLGGRAQADCVRGRRGGRGGAIFVPRDPAASDARLTALGLPAAGGELLVRRSVQREGRSRAFVNGQLATASQLSAATRGLLDISGQHEHVGLLDAATHIELIDAHAQLGPERASYAEAFARLAEAEKARAQLDSDETARTERAEWLRWQLEELKQAEVKPGEDDALSLERKRLASAEKLRAGALEAEGLLSADEGAAFEQVARAAKRLEELAQLDPNLDALAKSVRGAAAEIDQAGRELSRYAARAGGDPERLEQIDERLELLRKLARKHGGSIAALLARRQTMDAELLAIEDHRRRALAARSRGAEARGPGAAAGEGALAEAARGGGLVRQGGGPSSRRWAWPGASCRSASPRRPTPGSRCASMARWRSRARRACACSVRAGWRRPS